LIRAHQVRATQVESSQVNTFEPDSSECESEEYASLLLDPFENSTDDDCDEEECIDEHECVLEDIEPEFFQDLK
jgi:hypothetical protein